MKNVKLSKERSFGKMPTIQSKNGTPTAKLLRATANLSPLELDSFVNQAIYLRAKRNAPSVPYNEADLCTFSAVIRGAHC